MFSAIMQFQRAFRLFFLALAFLSLCPVPDWTYRGKEDLAQSVVFFPLVGALLGAVAAAVKLGLCAIGMPSFTAAAIALGVLCLLTGALHEDGLADCADGFGAGRDREERLQIMRDSRIGVYGAIALILSFLLRASALADMPAFILSAALALSRTAMPLLSLLLAPARPDGLGAKLYPIPPGWLALTFLLGCALAALALLPVAPLALPAASIAALLALLAVAAIAKWRIGGFTGDVFGASEQCVQSAVLVALAATIS